jgi:hypothetical protein
MARSGNPNPQTARLAKAAKAVKARPNAGDLSDLRRCLWLAVTRCTKAINMSEAMDDDTRKTVHALTQVSGVYIKLVEAVDLETRVKALEERHDPI